MRTRTAIGAAMVATFALLGQAIAEDKAKDEAGTSVQVKKEGKDPIEGMVHRASEIAGMDVRNPAGKEIGSVKDLVIDMKAGEVKYAALSYGGFLGLGDKLFAVPFDALTHSHNVGDDEHFMIFSADEATLKNAPGFDSDKWPNFADAQFSGGINKHYDKYRTRRAGEVRVETDNVKVKVDTNRDAKVVADTASNHYIHRASSISGMEVRNAAGTDLGKVNDLVVDMKSGKVSYAALSYGGFLGLGDKLFAVPWSAFEPRYDSSDKEYYLVLDLDETTLRKASGFDKDHWPNFADPKITDEINKYYSRKSETGDAVKEKETR